MPFESFFVRFDEKRPRIAIHPLVRRCSPINERDIDKLANEVWSEARFDVSLPWLELAEN